MNRHVTPLMVAASLALMTNTAWAKGPSIPYPVEVHGKVRSVNPQQQVIVLDDGTTLAATSPRQIDAVQPGSAVKVLFLEDGARKEIQRIELVK